MSDNDDDFMCEEEEDYGLVSICSILKLHFNIFRLKFRLGYIPCNALSLFEKCLVDYAFYSIN